MPNHTVRPGDCLNSLAKDYGFFNYQTIFKFGQNASNWKNPNMLEEGKTVDIPDKNPKKLPLNLDKEIKFVIDRRKTKLRVAVVDVEGEAPKVSKCKLTVGPATAAKLGARGLIELEIDPAEKTGSLALTLPALPAVDTGKSGPGALDKLKQGAGNKVPAHPPEIVARDFEDELEKDDIQPIEIELTLRIGFLEPHTAIRGGLQRLNNLGCKVPDPAARTAGDEDIKAVVKSYQRSKGQANPSGNISDILNDLEAAHDKI
jgi:hypothetical protein